MIRPPPFENGDGEDPLRDLMIIMFVMMVAIASIAIPHINARTVQASQEEAKAPGNVVIDVNWPPEFDTDVDLWVQGPGDVPVGYSNKGGVLFNLLRDDLGHVLDVSGMNYEVAYSRGLQPGRYTVNLHLYRNTLGRYPVPVTVIASTKVNPESPSIQILNRSVQLTREGQEVTVFSFELDHAGGLIESSIDTVQRYLRSGTKQ